MEDWLRELMLLIPDGPQFAAVLGVLAFVEGLAGVGLIVPGAILTVFGGFLVYHGKGDLLTVFLVTGIGSVCGDVVSYLLGARLGSRLWNHALLRRHHDLLRKAQLFFFDHGGKSVFFGRFIGPLRGLVPFIAGAAHMRPWPFIGWASISGLLWGIAYPGVGYLGGSSWDLARDLAGGIGAVIAVAAAIALYLGVRHRLFKN